MSLMQMEVRLRFLATLLNFSESAEEEFLAPPLLGEHTKQVLNGWLGYSDEELESLDKLQIIEMLK